MLCEAAFYMDRGRKNTSSPQTLCWPIEALLGARLKPVTRELPPSTLQFNLIKLILFGYTVLSTRIKWEEPNKMPTAKGSGSVFVPFSVNASEWERQVKGDWFDFYKDSTRGWVLCT